MKWGWTVEGQGFWKHKGLVLEYDQLYLGSLGDPNVKSQLHEQTWGLNQVGVLREEVERLCTQSRVFL